MITTLGQVRSAHDAGLDIWLALTEYYSTKSNYDLSKMQARFVNFISNCPPAFPIRQTLQKHLDLISAETARRAAPSTAASTTR